MEFQIPIYSSLGSAKVLMFLDILETEVNLKGYLG